MMKDKKDEFISNIYLALSRPYTCDFLDSSFQASQNFEQFLGKMEFQIGRISGHILGDQNSA